MGVFSKPEVIIMRKGASAQEYLAKLEDLLPKVSGALKDKVEKEIYVTKAGIAGEETILYELKNSGIDMLVIHDLYIEHGDKSAQIDFYVITPKMNFIIECKNLFGNLEINSKGDFIRTIEYGRKKYKEGIYSPITQNQRHMALLREQQQEGKNAIMRHAIDKTFDVFNKSLVVLANPKTVVNDRYAKKEVRQQIVRADQLTTTMKQLIKASKELSDSKEAMLDRATRILSRNSDSRRDYFEKFEEMFKESQLTDTNRSNETTESKTPVCPQCGSLMVLRNGKYGEFWGCSSYPRCRSTIKLQ